MTRTETINTTVKPFEVAGHYFELLKTVNPVNVKAYDKNGQLIANEQGVESGFYIDRRGVAMFARVEIETTGNESVTFLYSDGTTGTKRQSIAWYDRNPASRVKSFTGAAVAPHSQIVRWTYTCPTGKKALIEALNWTLIRDAESASPGRIGLSGVFTALDASSETLINAEFIDGSLGARDRATLGGAITMQAGETLQASTSDASVGGTIVYRQVIKVTEFNA